MKRQFIASLLSVSLLGLPVLVGCDETVSHKETIKETPSGTSKSETTVKEKADGTIVKEESKSVKHD